MRAPSNKVSIILLVTVILVTIVIAFFSYQNRLPENNNQNQTGELSVSIDLDKNTSTDFDGDGLLDWEESLWSTDPNNPDTDGDGTNDGDETEQNRNPLVAGPDDENYDFEERITESLAQIQIDESSLTNQATLNLVNQYFILRQNGELDATTKSQLISKITSDAFGQLSFKNIYSVNFVETFDTKDEEKLLEYANDILRIQNNLTLQFYGFTDPALAGKVSVEVLQASKDIAALKVPTGIIENHVALANAYYKNSEIIKNLNKEDEDPLLVMFTIGLYSEVQEEIVDLNEKLGIFLREGGIIYDNNELKLQSDEE